jgi:AraC-like DNA-binding protein
LNDSSVPAFRAHLPQPPLSRFIECLWAVSGLTSHKRERVLPNGVVEVIINLGSFHKVLARDDYARGQLYKESWVAGIQNRHLVIESVRESELIGIRFRPGGAYALFGLPMSELADQVIELDLVQKQRFADLRERLLAAGSTDGRFALVESMLLGALDFDHSGHPAVHYLASRLRAWDGAVRISALVEQVALSHKRLTQLFERDVGMTPKSLAQIYRFQAAIRRIAPDDNPDWSSVAADCGYYDQSHMIHDFRRLSGLTPSEYVATRLADINHAVVS